MRNQRQDSGYPKNEGSSYGRSSAGVISPQEPLEASRREPSPEDSRYDQWNRPSDEGRQFGYRPGSDYSSGRDPQFRSGRNQEVSWGTADLHSGRGTYSDESSRHSSQEGFGGSQGFNQSRRSESAGRFFGRGPKAYQRSDERITEDIAEELTRHPEIDAENIEIAVKDGEVVLTGSVPERKMRHLSEDLVEKRLGVKDVTNNLRVQKKSSSANGGTANSQN